VIRLTRTAITADMPAEIKKLIEKTRIDPFIREIIAEPTDTAHGSS
jgi:hypothetical protein